MAKNDFNIYSYDEIESELRKEILNSPEWSNQSETAIVNIVSKLVARFGQLISNEMLAIIRDFFPSSTQSDSAIMKFARFVNYEFQLAVTSTGRIRIRLESPVPHQVFIPQDFIASTKDKIFISLEADAIIPINAELLELDCVQGLFQTSDYLADGEPNYSIDIPDNSVEGSRFTVSVAGETWDRAEGNVFDYSTADDKVYIIRPLVVGIRIIFGDGRFGKKPNAGSDISMSFLQTNGASGEIRLVGAGVLKSSTKLYDSVTLEEVKYIIEVVEAVQETHTYTDGIVDYPLDNSPLNAVYGVSGIKGSIVHIFDNDIDYELVTIEGISYIRWLGEMTPEDASDFTVVTYPDYIITGGADRESIASVARNIPRYLTTSGGISTESEYKARLRMFSNIIDADVWAKPLVPSDPFDERTQNLIYLCAIPTTGHLDGYLSYIEKEEILTQLYDEHPVPNRLTFKNPEYVGVLISVSAKSNGTIADDVLKTNIEIGCIDLMNFEYRVNTLKETIFSYLYHYRFIKEIAKIDGLEVSEGVSGDLHIILEVKDSQFEAQASVYDYEITCQMHNIKPTTFKLYDSVIDVDYLIAEGLDDSLVTTLTGATLVSGTLNHLTGIGSLSFIPGQEPAGNMVIAIYELVDGDENLIPQKKHQVFQLFDTHILIQE